MKSSSSSQPASVLLRQFYKDFGMPGEGPPPALDLRRFDSIYPIEETERGALQHSLLDDRLRRMHNECRELLESLAAAMTGETLIEELSEGSRITASQFDRLTSGSLWHSLVTSIDQRDQRGFPVCPFPELAIPFKARFQMTIFGSLGCSGFT